jgi:hypothetical protein
MAKSFWRNLADAPKDLLKVPGEVLKQLKKETPAKRETSTAEELRAAQEQRVAAEQAAQLRYQQERVRVEQGVGRVRANIDRIYDRLEGRGGADVLPFRPPDLPSPAARGPERQAAAPKTQSRAELLNFQKQIDGQIYGARDAAERLRSQGLHEQARQKDDLVKILEGQKRRLLQDIEKAA